jgi:hypothetical protein
MRLDLPLASAADSLDVRASIWSSSSFHAALISAGPDVLRSTFGITGKNEGSSRNISSPAQSSASSRGRTLSESSASAMSARPCFETSGKAMPSSIADCSDDVWIWEWSHPPLPLYVDVWLASSARILLSMTLPSSSRSASALAFSMAVASLEV